MLRQYFTFVIKTGLGLYFLILLPTLSVRKMLIKWYKKICNGLLQQMRYRLF